MVRQYATGVIILIILMLARPTDTTDLTGLWAASSWAQVRGTDGAGGMLVTTATAGTADTVGTAVEATTTVAMATVVATDIAVDTADTEVAMVVDTTADSLRVPAVDTTADTAAAMLAVDSMVAVEASTEVADSTVEAATEVAVTGKASA